MQQLFYKFKIILQLIQITIDNYQLMTIITPKQKENKRDRDEEWTIYKSRLKKSDLKYLKQGQKQIKYFQWSLAQDYEFITFLQNYKWLFETSFKRKLSRVFIHMSKWIKSRCHKQIKSHNQKLMQKYGTLENIIKQLRLKVMEAIETDIELIKKIQDINKQFQNFYIDDQRNRKNLRKLIVKKLQIMRELNYNEEMWQEQRPEQLPQRKQRLQRVQRKQRQQYKLQSFRHQVMNNCDEYLQDMKIKEEMQDVQPKLFLDILCKQQSK